mmetsp:Transcript_10257/g.15658  ORF Transcript_10257/g.15658 Transcript_10257/m.15658 type:complete len:1785 (+) Transcript_10257:91-5445(+)
MERELERKTGKRGRPKPPNQKLAPVATIGTRANVALHSQIEYSEVSVLKSPPLNPLFYPAGVVKDNCAIKEKPVVYSNNDWPQPVTAATQEMHNAPTPTLPNVQIENIVVDSDSISLKPIKREIINEKCPKKNAVRKKKAGRPRGRRFSNVKKNYDAESAKSVKIKIIDDDPHRIINPLLDIPRLENAEIPNAAEMQVWSDIVFSKPNTYPLSYYARLLGFDVPEVPHDKYVTLLPSSLPLPKKIPAIGPLGTVINSWKEDDDILDYKEPVYEALTKETGEVVSTLKKAVFNSNLQRLLKAECLSLAKRLFGSDLPPFEIDDKNNDFGIKSGNYSIRYQFVWYRIKSKEQPKCASDLYGVPAASTQLKKPSISELVMNITSLGEIIYEKDPSKSPKQNAAKEVINEKIKCKTMPNNESKTFKVCTPKQLLNKVMTQEKDEVGFDERGQTDEGKIVQEDRILTVLMALALEHARACDVYYAFVQTSKVRTEMLIERFRMISLQNKGNSTPTTLLCDLNKTTSKYAFLLCQDSSLIAFSQVNGNKSNENDEIYQRILVKLPTHDLVKCILNSGESALKRSSTAKSTKIQSASKKRVTAPVSLRLQSGSVVTVPEEDSQKMNFLSNPSWSILRIFPLQKKSACEKKRKDEIYDALMLKRDELMSIETKVEPQLRHLLKEVIDDRMAYEKDETNRAMEREILNDYQKVLERRREMDLAFQKQRDQDMDAVCDICKDGEVTPDNQILFCEACNVAVHQYCYGIEKVPEGDYYCIACRYFGRDRNSVVEAKRVEYGAPITRAPCPLPITCELCPRKEGAFIRTEVTDPETNGSMVSKWVHMLCAKWNGLEFLDREKKDCVENINLLKAHFREHGTQCQLCKGNRGAFHKCRETLCNKWFHVTCARSYGRCEVIHGENCEGPVEHNPWTLVCPEHSNIEAPANDSVTLDQLILRAQAFPPEPRSLNRGFSKFNGSERREFLADLKNERAFVYDILMKRLQGVNCEVCFALEPEGKNLTRCSICSVVFCDSCTLPFDKQGKDNKNFTCQVCQLEKRPKSGVLTEKPSCVLCFQKGGWLRKARGFPPEFRMKQWEKNPKEFEKSMFGKSLWVHTLCYLWNYPELEIDETTEEVSLSNVIMSHGHGFVRELNVCELCGHKGGLKKRCQHSKCRQWGQKNKPSFAHLTCARQAGFEVNTRETKNGHLEFFIHCFKHSRCEEAFRARIEDLIEIEKFRVGKRLEMNDSRSMSISHASRLFNAAILVMQNLGWAWRWADWWVTNGSNWEPLIEEGQDESKMTKKQLKIVDSTTESRCNDARACRLAAFSAALRNRAYDNEVEGPTKMLDRALRALLATKSLVGPLEDAEIEHCAQWLGMAYRSKSKLLGFGQHKIPINESFRFCFNIDDNSPKFELGSRRIPGKQDLAHGQFFETDFNDIDDFLKPETLDDGSIYCGPSKTTSNTKRQKAGGKKSPNPGVENGTKERPTGQQVVEEKERRKSSGKKSLSLGVQRGSTRGPSGRQKSTDKVSSPGVEKKGATKGPRGAQAVEKKEVEGAPVVKRRGPGRPPKNKELKAPKVVPTVSRGTQSKGDKIPGSGSPHESLESVITRDCSGKRVDHDEVSPSRRKRRRSTPSRFYAEESDDEKEEKKELVGGSSSQNYRKRKRMGRTCEKQIKIEKRAETRNTRSNSADDLDPVEPTKREIVRRKTRRKLRGQRNQSFNNPDESKGQDSPRNTEIRKAESTEAQMVLSSDFQIPRKRRKSTPVTEQEYRKQDDSRSSLRITGGRTRGRRGDAN